MVLQLFRKVCIETANNFASITPKYAWGSQIFFMTTKLLKEIMNYLKKELKKIKYCKQNEETNV